MARMRRSWFVITLIIAWLVAQTAVAQEQPPPHLFITATDSNSLPTIELRAYGMDSFGVPLELTGSTVSVTSNGTAATPIVVGSAPVGTFTLFLIDVPTGLADQLAAIEQAITQYASTPTMAEQLDALAIYQIGETDAVSLLSPDTFHNSVRNLFAGGITPADGATALVDSTVSLLDQVATLKPDPAMAASIVIISDGTDIVSTQSELGDIGSRAAALGVPVHTIWANNPNLSEANREQGKSNMRSIAAAARGLSIDLDKSSDLPLIWERIASFRNQTRLSFTPEGVGSGETAVFLTLNDEPTIQAQTSITIPGNVPSVTLNIPADSRTLTLASLEDPVTLRLSASVSWLDGTERTITAAQLKVNELFVDIPINSLDNFEVAVPGLRYGSNPFQIIVLDEQEIRAQSPPVPLIVEEGSTSIPDALQPTLFSNGSVLRNLLLLMLAAGLLGGLLFVAWRSGWLTSLPLPRGRSRPRVRIEDAPNTPLATSKAKATTKSKLDADPIPQPSPYPHAIARLHLLESTTPLAAEFPLTAATIRLGRSPANNDIAFEQDITVSRQHAILQLEGTHYRIYDQNSTSGTWVNEQRVPEYGTQLLDGDDVHLGAVHLRYQQP